MNRAEKMKYLPFILPGIFFYGEESMGRGEVEEEKYIRLHESKELYEPDETITNHEVIDIIGLTVRWCGATDEDILRQNRLGNLPVYKVYKINRTPKGGIVRVLHPSSISIEEGGEPGEEEFFLIGIESVCLLPDVINVEKRRPDFLYKRITPHEEEPPSRPLVGESTHITELEAELTIALQRAEVAEQALADTRAELAETKAAALQEVSNPNLTPAQKAAQAKSEKSLAAWKEVFPAMMKVYARCIEEGEKPRQGPDFNAMFNELDAELTDSQLAFFRSCLPEGHSDTDGGKPGKV
ncbi:hypothetical protein [Bilophila wadsworthia]|uniref:hypothetical protein n=1 Tax=Bilophila wadsworthia TaxID=35833 RepID=UPI00242E297A|nr:hypothetical protein [Bilophila wadsworthia]